jgi:NADPH-dependent glutamate synthase beta subunit-like oxidoreductase
MTDSVPRAVVAIVGGATAGAEAAGVLADRGVVSVVFEQHPRPYGKIEDGLPRWHVKLRRKEYEAINAKLDRPEVHFVPSTKIGRDVPFPELVGTWGFTAVLLAHGAWRDRPLPIEGADRFVDRGLVYQNPFIHWFNHATEGGYHGPRYELADGAIVVGGGLASIDVMKVLQIETTRHALAARGIEVETLRLEHEGIPEVLGAHGLTWESLGLRGATLFYRRRVEDMPLTEIPENVDPIRRRKFETTRRRILEKATAKYLFHVRPERMPVGLLVEDDRLVGLRFQHTRVEDGRAVPVDGAFEAARAPLVVSSIGSVPDPIPGIARRGTLYDYADPELGRVRGYENVFAIGNVITGKGNIAVSRKHSLRVASRLVERFLGLGGHEGEERMLDSEVARARDGAAPIAAWVTRRPRLDEAQLAALLARVRARQVAVGYAGTYREWIARVTPPDMA